MKPFCFEIQAVIAGCCLLWYHALPVWAGFDDQTPQPPQPNDVPGTVNGCANAILAHDDDGNGVITKEEYLDLANNIADLLCLQPLPEITFELQTVFVSSACLCAELEEFDVDCCFGQDAGILVAGAADPVSRTEAQDSYLRSVCLLTQAILGPATCDKGLASFDEFASESADEKVVITANPGFLGNADPNGILGTVPGCAAALLEHDDNQDGAIQRDEYFSFANGVAELLCAPPKNTMDLQLQTSFISLACLCVDREGSEIDCCFGDNASIDLSGAADAGSRTADEDSYLRAVCVLTQAIFGHGQCEEPLDDDQASVPASPDDASGANDIPGTVEGCADALVAHDYDSNGVILLGGDEYLGFFNNIAEILCVPTRDSLDLELQTAFFSIACLCMEREGAEDNCCLGENASINISGAASADGSRTQEQEGILQAACLMTQAAAGPDQCDDAEAEDPATGITVSPTSEVTMESTLVSSLRGTAEPTSLSTISAALEISKSLSDKGT